MTSELAITGMTCNGCVRHVDQALRTVAGVTAVAVDLAGGRARVAHGAETPAAALIGAVEAAGYDATLAAAPGREGAPPGAGA